MWYCKVEPVLLLLLLFLLHVWHTRECIYHHFSLFQQHCIWKRIRKKGKADGTGMYMWTTHHEEHWLLVSKACFLLMSPHVHSYRWWLSAVSPAMRFLAEDENPTVQTNDCTDALLKTEFSFGMFQDQHSMKTRRMSEACTNRRCLMSVRKRSLVPLSQFHSGSMCNWYPFGLLLCANSGTPGSSWGKQVFLKSLGPWE